MKNEVVRKIGRPRGLAACGQQDCKPWGPLPGKKGTPGRVQAGEPAAELTP